MKIAPEIISASMGVLLLGGCATTYMEGESVLHQRYGKIYSTSTIRLISNPEKYDGKPVRVEGFVRIEVEDDCSVSMARSPAVVGSSGCIWLDLTIEEQLEKKKVLTGKRCIIEGIYDMRHRGNGGLYCGSICEITRLEPIDPQP